MRQAAKSARLSAASTNSQIRIEPLREVPSGVGSEYVMKKREHEKPDVLVSAAFDELADQNGSVTEEFRKVFANRSRFPEMPEWGGKLRGLIRTLGQLLRRVPPESYLRKNYGKSCDHDLEFRECFKKAVVELAHRDPEALDWFETNIHKHDLSRVAALRALLARYVADQQAYPN